MNAVVAEAGLAKGTFYVHFADRDAFLDALHERFHANIGRGDRCGGRETFRTAPSG